VKIHLPLIKSGRKVPVIPEWDLILAVGVEFMHAVNEDRHDRNLPT
jgi:hypothetical protein